MEIWDLEYGILYEAPNDNSADMFNMFNLFLGSFNSTKDVTLVDERRENLRDLDVRMRNQARHFGTQSGFDEESGMQDLWR